MLAAEPRNFDALHFLGVAAYQLGRHAEAVGLIRQALAINDTYAPAHSNLGNALEAAGQADAALAAYRKALALAPDYADAWVNLGALLAARGEPGEAESAYRKALALNPAQPIAHSNLGNVLRQLGRLEEAAASHRRALELAPREPSIHSNLGNLLHQQGRLDEAAAALRKSIELDPRFAEGYLNLGNVLSDQGRLGEAIAAQRRAVELRPGLAEAHSNLGNTYVQNGQLAEGEHACREALRLKPESSHAQFNLALLRLLQGDYAEGLQLYESRFQEKALSRLYATLHTRAAQLHGTPRWRGEAGRGLLVWTDQGLGDSLMLLRYLPLIKARGVKRLAVYCEAPLVRLVQGLDGVDEVIPASKPLPAGFDLQCPIMSLPLVFGTRLESIPSQPYLKVDGPKKLSGVKRPRVGLLWAGGPLYPRNHLRSIRLAQLAPVMKVPGISFVSLQKGDEQYQLHQSGWPIVDRMDECKDLHDTAALIGELDLVIGVDSAVAHLTGALGKPMWMLNRFESEWRWLLGREDSPWYPSIRVLRQPRPGEWDSVIDRVAEELADLDFGVGRH